MTDYISRADAIDAVTKLCVDGYKAKVDGYFIPLTDALINTLSALPSADAVQGEWILVKGSNGKDYHKCSKCLHTQEITGVKNYCAVCGAIMKGGDDE